MSGRADILSFGNRFDLPSLNDVVALPRSEQLALLARLDHAAEGIAAVRGALHALLHEPPPPAPLIDAKEAARRLCVSVDYVRDHGAALEIEVWLDGVVRYDPARVEAARQRRRPRNSGQASSTLTDLLHAT